MVDAVAVATSFQDLPDITWSVNALPSMIGDAIP